MSSHLQRAPIFSLKQASKVRVALTTTMRVPFANNLFRESVLDVKSLLLAANPASQKGRADVIFSIWRRNRWELMTPKQLLN